MDCLHRIADRMAIPLNVLLEVTGALRLSGKTQLLYHQFLLLLFNISSLHDNALIPTPAYSAQHAP